MPHASAIGLGAVAIGGAAAAAAAGAHGGSPVGHAHGCVWHSPSGSTYDLTSLADTEFHVNGAGGFRYSLSVCKPLRALPLRCAKSFPDGGAAAPAIQEDAFGSCHVLGSTRHVTFAQADAHDPSRGVIVTYGGGAPCANGHARTVRVHLTCSHSHAHDAAPASVTEEADGHSGAASCAYDVAWPSPHGCPMSSLSSLLLHARMGVLGSSGGAHALHINTPAAAGAHAGATSAAAAVPPHAVSRVVAHGTAAVAVMPASAAAAAGSDAAGFWTVSNLLWVSTVLWYGGLALYCALGSVVNVWAGRGECGWSAIPHKTYWDTWLEAMLPASLRAKALALPVLGHALTACVAVVGAAAKVCHWCIVATRAVWRFTAGGIGRRLPASWARTRWFLAAGDAANGSANKGSKGGDAAAAAAGSDASVRLKNEGGATDGALVRRIAAGAGAGGQPTFAADVKTASEAAARRAGASAAGAGGGLSAADFAAVRIEGFSMKAEQAAAGGSAAAAASAASSSSRGAGASASLPPQGLGQDEDGHGTPFGPSVATADLLLRGDTGMAPQAGAPVPQAPVVKRR